MAGSVSDSLSGSGPALMEKDWYSPGLMPAPGPAVQVISLTASVIVAPSASTGGFSVLVVVVAVQPGTGLTLTNASGVSVGDCTRRLVVEAVSLSVGTRKVTSPNPPGAASGELTETCAEATPTPRAKTATMAASAPRRHGADAKTRKPQVGVRSGGRLTCSG
jgi:hypothetical protein